MRDLRYARQGLSIDAAGATAGKETTLALEPARIIEGRVLAADTGQPIPNAIVSATTLVQNEPPAASPPPGSAPTTGAGSS